jgi:hypothetical protein
VAPSSTRWLKTSAKPWASLGDLLEVVGRHAARSQYYNENWSIQCVLHVVQTWSPPICQRITLKTFI